MPEQRRPLRWRRVVPLAVAVGFVVVSAHRRIVSAEPRAGGESGSQLELAIEAVANGEDLTPFTDDNVSFDIHYVGSRRLVTVAVLSDDGLCLLARSSQPGYIEYAVIESDDCFAKQRAAAPVEWLVDSLDAWQ